MRPRDRTAGGTIPFASLTNGDGPAPGPALQLWVASCWGRTSSSSWPASSLSDRSDPTTTADPFGVPLHPLPAQPAGMPCPTEAWLEGGLPGGVDLDALVARAFDPDGPLHETYAVVIVHRGRLALDEPAPVPAWQSPWDPRRAITSRDLLAMRSAATTFDDAGTWVASSYAVATARDFARFGPWYLRDGVWEGHRMLPEGWVDDGRRARSVDPDDGNLYGPHWWTAADPFGTFLAAGHEGQYIDVCPALDLVLVRMGRTDTGHSADLHRWRAEVIRSFDEVSAAS